MVVKKRKLKKKKQSPAQKAASKKNIKKAQAAKRKGTTKKRKAPKKKTTKKRGGRRVAPRKKKKGRSRFGIPSIGGIIVGLNALNQLGIINAMSTASTGNISGAASQIANSFNVGTFVNAALPAIGLKVARQITGPINLFKVGKFNVRLI